MTDTGVVDPIRVPPWLREGAERAWRETPVVARAFIGVAVVDGLGRLVGILPPTIALDQPLGLLTGVVSLLWILLPAFLVLRRPDARAATPWLLVGATANATLGVVTRPVEGLLAPSDLTGLSGGYVAVRLVIAVVTAWAWILLARGLVALNPRRPEPFTAGLSNLVLTAFLVVAVIQLLWLAVRPIDVGDSDSNAWLAILDVAAVGAGMAQAYFLWVAVRGLDDGRRPAIARQVVMAAAVLGAFASLTATIVSVALTLSPPPCDPFGPVPMQAEFFVLAGASSVASGLVVIAFILGLGEPPIPLAVGAAPASGGTAEPGPESAVATEAPGNPAA